MAKIEKLNDYREDPHLSGEIKCMNCAEKWHGISPVGTVNGLECPKCGCFKGVFISEVIRDEQHWHCKCGNCYFLVTPEGYYCSNCGDMQNGF